MGFCEHPPSPASANLRIFPTASRADGELHGVIGFGGATGFSVRVPTFDDLA